MNELFMQLAQQLRESPSVGVAAAGILAAALLLYLFWIFPAFRSVEGGLRALERALKDASDQQSISGWIADRKRLDPSVRAAWAETAHRIVPVGESAGRQGYATFGSLRDIWSPSRLIGRSINLPLAEAIPNLLVGAGLLLTFLFLTLAIVSATAALNPPASINQPEVISPLQSGTDSRIVDPAAETAGQTGSTQTATPASAIDGAMRNLLGSAGAKFLTSLAGLLASITWTIAFRRRMRDIGEQCERVADRIARFAPPDAGERMALAQIGHDKVILTTTAEQTSLLDELLQESREQTGTLKRFETDVAIAIGRAINSGLAPQLEEMTRRLTQSIDKLTERMASINQDALEKMLNDFAALLKKATETEMSQLQETLKALAEALGKSGEDFGKKAGEAGQEIGAATKTLVERVDEVATKLVQASQNVLDTSTAFSQSTAELTRTVDQVSTTGRAGGDFVTAAIAETTEQVARMSEVSQVLRSTANDLGRLGSSIVDVLSAVDAVAREQRLVIQTVKEATPDAMRSVDAVLKTLHETVTSTQAAMTLTRNSMKQTTEELEKTVGLINGGVKEYSATIADLHARMDQYMARAIGDLGNKITGLEEVLEELAEVTDRTATPR